MLREKIDKARGWWRKLNRPLVSELPRPVIWMSLAYTTLALVYMIVGQSYIYGQTTSELFHDKDDIIASIFSVFITLVLLIYCFTSVGLLSCSSDTIGRNALLRWRRDEEIKNFTLIRPFIATGFVMIMVLAAPVVIPAMKFLQNTTKLELLVLEKMRDGNLSLDDEWLKSHDILMQQYALIRQSVINDGWDHTYGGAVNNAQDAFLVTTIMILLLCVVISNMLIDIYLAWRYYPRGNRT